MIIAILSDPIWHWNYLRLLRNYNEKLEREQASEESQQDEKPTENTSTNPPDGGALTRKPTTSHLKSEPEFRLPPTILGGPLATIGLFLFSWTTYPSISFYVPLVGAGFFGTGIILSFSGIFTFLVEAFPLYAASALSANSFLRSSFAGGFPLFGVQMFEKLGRHWAGTLLALLCAVCAPAPVLFYRYGKALRGRSRFGGAR